MTAFTFCPVERAVFWGTTRLDPQAADDQLALYERIGGPEAIAAHNELSAAVLKAGGIARTSNLRAA